MGAPIIRGPKIPLAWSTIKTSGYVVDKHDEDEKVDQVLIEDEDSQIVTEVTNLRPQTDVTIDVMPLSGLNSPPKASDLFTYGTKQISITSIKKSREKGQAVKWTISGNFLPGIHQGS